MTLLDSTCQIALAALTESLGEFARRADAAAPSAPEDLFQFLNCPQPGSAPDAFARAVIAKASSIASGSAEAAKPGNARTLRLKTLFEQVRVEGESWASGRSHYPLEALSAGSIFPKKGDGKKGQRGGFRSSPSLESPLLKTTNQGGLGPPIGDTPPGPCSRAGAHPASSPYRQASPG